VRQNYTSMIQAGSLPFLGQSEKVAGVMREERPARASGVMELKFISHAQMACITEGLAVEPMLGQDARQSD